jgi:hypothetical protein
VGLLMLAEETTWLRLLLPPWQNHDIAWKQLNDDPDDFDKYRNKWKPEFKDVSRRRPSSLYSH